MQVAACFYVHESMLESILSDRSLPQLVNATTLPGIQSYALAKPDIHEGYCLPIGCVVATAIDEGGVISPAAIGFDINCGVRLLVTQITKDDLKPHL